MSVRVPGLGSLGGGLNYVLVGTPDANDACRPVPPASIHYQTHNGSPKLNRAVRKIADEYAYLYPGIKLRVNDMSLKFGGVLDVNNNWRQPHKTHRKGTNADIGFNGLDENNRCVELNQIKLLEIIRAQTNRKPYEHSNHYHIYDK